MANQQNVMANITRTESKDEKVNHILQVNDDCILEVFQYVSLIELSRLSETCKHFQNIARIVFKRRSKNIYAIPHRDVKFTDHPRILRNFGDLIDEVSVINFTDLFKDSGLSPEKMGTAFNWLERYCAETVQSVTILDSDSRALPPSAAKLTSKVKKITIYSPISIRNAQILLCGCKELVELNMAFYDGPFHLDDQNFPNLRKLADRVRIRDNRQFGQLERFFANHSKLTDLKIHFLVEFSYRDSINFSFVSHLVDLEKLEFMISGARISHIEALAKLTKLKELTFDQSEHMDNDVAILKNVTSSLDLEKLKLGFSEIHHLVNAIERLKSLTHLTITHDMLPLFHQFDTNISCLSQLKNSRLIQLRISCNELLESKAIVDIVRNLSELKTIIFWCIVDLSESICKQLAAVCSLQRRNIEIILCEELMESDFAYIPKFNEESGHFVRITTK